MSFTKLEYSFDQADIYCQCSYNRKEYPENYTCSSCNLPLTFNGYVLLQTIPDSDHHGNIHWEDKIYITWSCDASYNAYLILFCFPFMVIISIVLICSDIVLPLINSCKHQNSDSNAAADNEQSGSFQCCSSMGVPFVVLRLLIVLLILLVSVCAMVLVLTTILTAISSIFLDIPRLSDSKLKLGLLATSAGLFVASIVCTKLKQCIQKKLYTPITVMRQRQSHQTSNTNDIISSALQSDVRTHLQNLTLKLLCVCCVVPLVIITILSMSAMLTFLEAFFPVLSIYGSEADSLYLEILKPSPLTASFVRSIR